MFNGRIDSVRAATSGDDGCGEKPRPVRRALIQTASDVPAGATATDKVHDETDHKQPQHDAQAAMGEEQVQEVGTRHGVSDTTQAVRRAAPSESANPDVPSEASSAGEVKAAKREQLGAGATDLLAAAAELVNAAVGPRTLTSSTARIVKRLMRLVTPVTSAMPKQTDEREEEQHRIF